MDEKSFFISHLLTAFETADHFLFLSTLCSLDFGHRHHRLLVFLHLQASHCQSPLLIPFLLLASSNHSSHLMTSNFHPCTKDAQLMSLVWTSLLNSSAICAAIYLTSLLQSLVDILDLPCTKLSSLSSPQSLLHP